MNRAVALISIAAAFAAGCGVTHLLRPALAAENITAQIIHVPEMNGDALGLASGTGLRSRPFVSADGATVAVQDGNVPKHMHVNANEMQYILEGTGTIWLGDKEVQVKPGDFVIIPKDEQWAELQPFYSWASQTWCEAVSQAARHVEFQRNIRTFPAFVQSLINILSEERAVA